MTDIPDLSAAPAADLDLAGRVALVTGSGRGIGRSIAMELAAAGASVVALARSQQEVEETASTIRDLGGEATALCADLTDVVVAELASRIEDRHGRVDLLVNNAGTVGPLKPTVGVVRDEVATAFALNVFAPFALTAGLLPGMLVRGWGRVINVSSGVVARPGSMRGGNVYVATKSALEAHTHNLAAEIASTGVTANVYRPGSVDTTMQGHIRAQDPVRVGGGLVERFRTMHSDGMLITPEHSARSLMTHLARGGNGEVWTATRPRPDHDQEGG